MHISITHYRELLSQYLLPQRYGIVLLAMLLLAGIVLNLVNPQIARHFIDTAISGSSESVLVLIAIAYVAVGLLSQITAVLTAYSGSDVGWRATNRLRSDLARHCLTLDMSFHGAHTPGEMIERVDGDVTELAGFLSTFLVNVVGNALLILGVIVALWREDSVIGFAFLMFAGLALAVLYRSRDTATSYWIRARSADANLYGFLEERLGGIEDIRGVGAARYVMLRFYELSRRHFLASRLAQVMGTAIFSLTGLLLTLGYLLGFGAGIYLYRQGQATIGTVFMIVNYAQLLIAPLQQLTSQAGTLQRAAASVYRIQELRNLNPAVQETQRLALPAGALSVEFQDVSFGYEEGNQVLQGVSFRLEPGKVLGLLGRTGGGKTTISRLLVRLYDPDAGQVRLGGMNVRDVALADLHSKVGVVTQDVQLFNATVRDNLTLFNSNVSDEHILEAMRSLGLARWFESLPNGLDSELMSGGHGLSAGEAQLLALTRLFLKDPGLVVLDEASSRLDPATERLIRRAMDALLEGRTAIIIAHKLETVLRADQIMVLENGCVAEHGDREALEADSGSRYYALLRAGLEEMTR